MSFSDLRSVEVAQTADRELDELRAKRSRDLMVRHNREMKARQEAEATAKAQRDAAQKAAKEKKVQADLDARVRARILSGNSATEADVKRLYDKVRDEIILEDGRKAGSELEIVRRRQLRRALRNF
jgi:hypothetical protein